MDTHFLFAAIAVMLIVIVTDYLNKRFNIDLNNIELKNFENKKASATVQTPQVKNEAAIKKSTGLKSVILTDCGANKATVMATLRQITGMDYMSAKKLVDSVPCTIMSNVSEKEADMNKRALEFVGAKIEIK